MALDANIVGSNLDSNNNIKVTTPSSTDQAGYVMLSGTLSGSTDPAGLVTQPLRSSTQGRLTIGQPIVLMNEIFHNTAQNTAIFQAPVTTQTVTFAGGTANLNASAITTLSTVSRLSTYAYFPILADMALYTTFDALINQTPQVNNTVEFGFIICTASTLPTDGAFFRYDNTGTLKAVLNTNGTEITSNVLTAPSANIMHRYKIIIENDRSLFYIDGVCQAIILTPTGLGMPIYSASVPWTARTFTSATAPSLATTVKISYIFVGQQDLSGQGKNERTLAAFQGRIAAQGQTGQTMGSTALFTNSLAPGAGAAMTNTTAALGSGLGGQFSALPTLTASTDGIISSYQNPLPTSAIPGKTLYITGVRISSIVTTALTGGPVYYIYSLAFGHTSVSLATTEAATGTKAPRRIPLGTDSFVVTAPLGTLGKDNYITFNSPIGINPGEFVQVVGKNVGTVTTAGVITFLISFDGFWE